ncbi:MAG: zf-TFIIB domain-containing protein [Candidatus Cloacimonetes bacterium]|nr:zf-TFIIB domain-containing protein [Candidatus Cloacimonadota bacterium]
MRIDKEKIRQMIRAQAGIVSSAKCPVCVSEDLMPMKIEGVEQDFCSKCNGIWLDAGEAADIAEGVSDIPDFVWSWSLRKPSKKLSPRHPSEMMWEMPYARGHELMIDYCEKSKGIWLDQSELYHLERIVADNTTHQDRVGKLVDNMKKQGLISL